MGDCYTLIKTDKNWHEISVKSLKEHQNQRRKNFPFAFFAV